MAANDGQPTQQTIAQAITEVSEKAQILIREEIELAKAEVTEKVTKLIKGAVVGMAAGVFVVFALLFMLHGAAWLAWYFLPVNDNAIFWGFFVVAGALLILAAIFGYLAWRWVRAGAPPVPEMAIDEAKLIREAVSSSQPESAIPASHAESTF